MFYELGVCTATFAAASVAVAMLVGKMVAKPTAVATASRAHPAAKWALYALQGAAAMLTKGASVANMAAAGVLLAGTNSCGSSAPETGPATTAPEGARPEIALDDDMPE